MKMRSPRFCLFAIAFLVSGFFFCHVGEVRAGGTLSADKCNKNCQGIINTALAGGGTVHLNAGTYVISGKILMPSNTTLEGSKGAIIKLIDNANWAKDETGGMLQGKSNGVSNIRITGFEIDGNRSHNTTSNGAETACGRYFYTMIAFRGGSNIEVDHMYLHDNWNDIFKITDVSNASFHDNTVRNPGHDIVYASRCNGVKCFNNYVLFYCNSAFRSYYSSDMQVYDNVIGDESSSGWVGIEVQGTPAVQINNNKFTVNGGGNSNINGPTTNNSSLKAPHSPEYPTTDSKGKSILEGNGTASESTGTDTGDDSSGDESGDSSSGDESDGSSGGSDSSSDSSDSSVPAYNYSNSSILPEIKAAEAASPATPDDQKAVSPLFPSPDEDKTVPETAKGACIVKNDGNPGLIPCGRSFNYSSTSWNECDECDLCSLILMGELIINFLLKMAAIAAVLSIIASGFLYIFAAGKADLIKTSKSMMKYTLMGFVFIFIAWMIVDSILTTLGYIDPIGGEWYTTCEDSSSSAASS